MRFSFILLWIFWVSISILNAGQIQLAHDPMRIDIIDEGDFQRVDYIGMVNGAALSNEYGNPDLPVYIKTVLLNPSEEIASITVHSITRMELEGTFNIPPKHQAWSQENDALLVAPNAEIYNSSKLYPQKVVRYLGTQHFNGQAVAHFAISPFQYNPREKKLFFIQQIDFSFTTKLTEKRFVQPKFGSNSSLLQTLTSEASNINFNDDFTLPSGNTDQIDPEILASGVIDRYVIVTTEQLAPAFEPLVQWKIERGVPTVIRTMEWIRQQFPDGVDDAERLRHFIQWSYQQRGTKYLLLGGDTDIIPTRIVHTGNFTFPTDYYYADLDGTWNANQNDTFGEAKDNLEGYPEVYVGRIPVLTTNEVNRFLQKLFEYEKFENIDSQQFPASILYLAGDLQRPNDSRDQLILKHLDPLIPSSFARTMVSQQDQTGNSPEVPLQELNRSYGFIFSEGHGLYFTYRPGARGSDLYNYHLNELTTPDPPIWYMASCYTNDISKRCFGEDFILSPTGGGVAYIGNSSWEYPFSGIYLEKEFFNLAFYKNFYHLSEAHYLSRLPYLGYLNFEGPSRIIVYSTIVLGDPEMPIWTAPVKTLLVQDSLIMDQTNRYLQVAVSNQDSTKNPVNNATVVLYKKDQLYKIARTNQAGIAQINLNGIVLDSVKLTVWARNFKPQQKWLNLSANEPYACELTQTLWQNIKGNNNGQCEPGEVFDIFFKIKNTGLEEWPAITRLHLNENSGLCRLSDTLLFFDQTVAPGQIYTSKAITLQINKTIKKDTTILLKLAVEPLRAKRMIFDIPVTIHTAQLMIERLSYISLADSTDHYTTSKLLFELKNTGSGYAWQVTGNLSSQDTSINILNNTFFIESIPEDSTVLVDNVIVQHKRPLNDVRFQLEITDSSGSRWMYHLDFVPPQRVENMSFKPAIDGGITLNWSPVSANDIYGYFIYRSTHEEGPFHLLTQTPITNAGYFVDEHADAGMRYFYTMQALDSSGNYSTFSDTIETWSSLPFQAGFPVRPNVRAIGSEMSGVTTFDLDGDGLKEMIISGSNGQLHVYNWRAQLLFESEGMVGNLTFPAVGQITGDDRKEIVVASYTEGVAQNYVYVIDSQNGQVIAQADLGYNAPTPVVVADLDGDGLDEILVLTHANNAPEPPKNSRLYIFADSNGVLTGFKDWPDGGYMLSGSASVGNIAVADIDLSGQLSVLLPTVERKLYCFKPNLSTEPIWTKSFVNALEAPLTLADINNDDSLEIIVPVVRSDLLFVLKNDGSELAGWEGGKTCHVTNPYWRTSPAIVGNVDDDDQLEIIYVGRDAIYIFEPDGSLKAGFPVAIENGDSYFDSNWEVLPPYNSPTLADIDQDGTQDIIYLDAFGYIHALNSVTKTEVVGFPLYIQNSFIKAHSPVIDDVDADGDLDVLLVNHEGVLFVWDAPQKYQESTIVYWSQPFANPQHTGTYTPLKTEFISAIQTNETTIPKDFYLGHNYPNPFNPQTTIIFGLKQTAQIQLTIFNVLGQKVLDLSPNQVYPAGVHKIIWSGKNRFNREVATGIYFCQMRVKDPKSGKLLFSQVQKMIKLK